MCGSFRGSSAEAFLENVLLRVSIFNVEKKSAEARGSYRGSETKKPPKRQIKGRYTESRENSQGYHVLTLRNGCEWRRVLASFEICIFCFKSQKHQLVKMHKNIKISPLFRTVLNLHKATALSWGIWKTDVFQKITRIVVRKLYSNLAFGHLWGGCQ